MRTYLEAKAMAKHLRARLAEKSIDLAHSECLELIAGQFGYDDWNAMAARIALGERRSAEMAAGIRLRRAVPVLRIFSREKAKAFYVGFLGFSPDWQDDTLDAATSEPLYTQVSRGKLVLHLSEHHGDGSPGSVTYVAMKGIDAFHRELAGKDYPNMRPGISIMPPRLRVLEVIDPFGNRLRFGEISDHALKDDGSPA